METKLIKKINLNNFMVALILNPIFICLMVFTQQVRAERLDYPEIAFPVEEMRPIYLLGYSDAMDVESEARNKSQQFLFNIEKKVFRYKDDCSAVFVSDTGYALTALHCLDMTFHYLPNPIKYNPEMTESGIKLNYFKSLPELNGMTYNVEQYHTSMSIKSDKNNKMTIIYMGAGYPYPNKDWDNSIIGSVALSRIKQQNDDFALVKFDKIPNGFECAKISRSIPKQNEIIWLAGFPKYVDRIDLKNPRLMLQTLEFLSEKDNWDEELKSKIQELNGLYSSQIEDSQIVKYIEASERPLYISVGRYFDSAMKMSKAIPVSYGAIDYLDYTYDSKRYFFSTAMSGPGMSGGGAFNMNHSLVGLNNAKPKLQLSRLYKKGLAPATIHISTKHIYDEILNKLGQEFVNKVFSCRE